MKKFLLVLLIVVPFLVLKNVNGATHTSLTCSREELTNEELIQIESLIYVSNDFYGKSKFDFSKYNLYYVCKSVNSNNHSKYSGYENYSNYAHVCFVDKEKQQNDFGWHETAIVCNPGLTIEKHVYEDESFSYKLLVKNSDYNGVYYSLGINERKFYIRTLNFSSTTSSQISFDDIKPILLSILGIMIVFIFLFSILKMVGV